MSYDQYGCSTKELNVITEMINKYPVKHKMKDFLLKKVSFFIKWAIKEGITVNVDFKLLRIMWRVFKVIVIHKSFLTITLKIFLRDSN